MKSITVEFQRYGDQTGILKTTDRYLRTVGVAGHGDEVPPPLDQRHLSRAMAALAYTNFGPDPTPERVTAVRKRAEAAIAQLRDRLIDFLPVSAPYEHQDGEAYQIDVVAHPLELAQLPFEALEELVSDVVITRRLRRPWAGPAIVESNRPKVLFAWADAGGGVPWQRHRELLHQLLNDWGGADGPALVELANATPEALRACLAADDGFTHVHVLAHGIGPPPVDHGAEFDLDGDDFSEIFVALETSDGKVARCSADEMADMFASGARLPRTVTVAACHSAQVDSVQAGATFGHALHGAGIPVVVASQLALTKTGSDELLTSFLANVIDGEDPREALRLTRASLRAAASHTFYDGVAVVGYIHLESDFDQRLAGRKFELALARLDAASQRAEELVGQLVGGDAIVSTMDLKARFLSVRDRLDKLETSELSKKQREELHGLQASSFKREADAAWRLSQATDGVEAARWLEASHAALPQALAAYGKAATVSLDHHWVAVQWLALLAVTSGHLDDHQDDWIIAERAATTAREEAPVWARGSLIELHLLATLLPSHEESKALDRAKEVALSFVEECRRSNNSDAVASTLKQLDRYGSWWARDPACKPPAQLIEHARELHEYLGAAWAQAAIGSDPAA